MLLRFRTRIFFFFLFWFSFFLAFYKESSKANFPLGLKYFYSYILAFNLR